METTLIRKVKRPSGATGLWAAYELGEDEHGHWLFTPKGSTFLVPGPDVDLELDLLADAEGTVFVDDEDEFTDRCREGVIAAGDETAARAATSEMEERLRSCAEPFGTLGWERMSVALELGLPPLRSLP